MSRTDNTMPGSIQAEDGRTGISADGHVEIGTGRLRGGSYQRIGRDYLRRYWRAQRVRVRLMLARGTEPPPEQHRHSEKWDY
jgi:hypothetical protein